MTERQAASGFAVGGGGEPDEIDLELRSLGAATPAEAGSIDASPGLDAARDELRAWETWWKRSRPPLPLPRPARVRWGAVGAVLLAAALLVAVLLAGGPAPEGVRPMGGLPVDVAVTRGTEALPAPFRFRPGDDVRVRLVAPREGLVEVWTVQDDGRVSVLEPGHPVRAGERFVLDGAGRLDDHRGREWLVVTLVPTGQDHGRSAPGRDTGTIEREARSLLPEPAWVAGPDRWVLEVTRTR